MKTTRIRCALLISCVVFLLTTAVAETARHVTLLVGHSPASQIETNSVTIGANETAQLVSYPQIDTVDRSRLQIVKDGVSWEIGEGFLFRSGPFEPPITVAGPAILSLRNNSPGLHAFCTFKITPDSFSADKTAIIPEGTTALISLECSTNLLVWTNVWSGAYSNVPTHKFFRLSVQRMP